MTPMRNRFKFRALSLLCTLALLTGLLTVPASAADTPDAWAAGEAIGRASCRERV